ncbi:MAG: (d)CMP kinase [Acidimicrobiia bacterium]
MIRVIAVDGPSGSGKSTVSRALATRLGLEVLDTGAMYRAVTLAVLESGVALDDAGAAGTIAARARIEVGERVLLDGRDVSAAIRGPEVTGAVSAVSAHPAVRTVLVDRQRAWVAERGGGVVEGRDIGTVVFPDAPLKVFLTASEAERARRRHGDEAAAARVVDVQAVAEDLARRDQLDQSRATSPLAAADDAVVVDSTDQGIDEIVADLLALADARFAPAPGRGAGAG